MEFSSRASNRQENMLPGSRYYVDAGLGNGAVCASSPPPKLSPSSDRTAGRGPLDRNMVLAGRGRTLIGHQNQRPSSAAMEGVMNERTTNVSNSRPKPIVVPT